MMNLNTIRFTTAFISIGSLTLLQAQTTPEFPFDSDQEGSFIYYPNDVSSGEHGTPSDSVGSQTDGNPASTTGGAATATANDNAFATPGQIDSDFETTESEPDSTSATSSTNSTLIASQSIDIEAGAGSYNIGDVEANNYTIRIPYSYKMTPRGTLNISVPLSITNLESVVGSFSNGNLQLSDAQVYGYGLNLSYAQKVFMKSDNVPYRWKVSPSTGIFFRDSSDLNQGSLVLNLGLSSSFAYQFTPGWVVNVGNSISFAFNNGFKDYPDPVTNEQQVMINGIQLFRLSGRWTHHAYIMDTRFLKDAFVDSYQSYSVGTAFKLTRKRSIRASLIYEDGIQFSSFRVTLGSTWKF